MSNVIPMPNTLPTATDCPSIPADTQLPLVLITGEVVSSGRKISIPVIRRKVEEIVEVETV